MLHLDFSTAKLRSEKEDKIISEKLGQKNERRNYKLPGRRSKDL